LFYFTPFPGDRKEVVEKRQEIDAPEDGVFVFQKGRHSGNGWDHWRDLEALPENVRRIRNAACMDKCKHTDAGAPQAFLPPCAPTCKCNV